MQAQYPANTNVLYVDLPSVEKIASSQSSRSLPGMILNLKKPIVYKDYLGVTHRLDASFQITIVCRKLLLVMHGILDLYIEIAVHDLHTMKYIIVYSHTPFLYLLAT